MSLHIHPLLKKNISSGGRKNKCNLCHAEFKNEIEENNHMITHNRPEVGFPCNKCFNVFLSKKTLHLHNQQCLKYSFYKAYCAWRKSVERYANDNKSQHFQDQDRFHQKQSTISYKNRQFQTSKKIRLVTNCQIAFNSELNSSNSKESSDKEQKLNCNMHLESFENNVELNNDEQCHSRLIVYCPICFDKFANSRTLAIHVYNKHVSKLKMLVCHICKTLESSKRLLTDHIMCHNLHLNKENSELSIDGFVLPDSNRNLEDSRMSPANKVIYNFKLNKIKEKISCPLCHNDYIETQLEHHILNKHVIWLSNFECAICQKHEPSASELTTHLIDHAYEYVSHSSKIEAYDSHGVDWNEYEHFEPVKCEVESSASCDEKCVVSLNGVENTNVNKLNSKTTFLNSNHFGDLGKVHKGIKMAKFGQLKDLSNGNGFIQSNAKTVYFENSLKQESYKDSESMDGCNMDTLSKCVFSEQLMESGIKKEGEFLQHFYYSKPSVNNEIDISDISNESTKPKVCTMCSQTFLTKEHLMEHVIVHI